MRQLSHRRPRRLPALLLTLTLCLLAIAIVIHALRSVPRSQLQTASTVTFVPINSAPAQTLCLLPGIGPAIAQRIIEGRPYHSMEDLDDVKGLGPLTLERIADYIVFDPPAEGTKD